MKISMSSYHLQKIRIGYFENEHDPYILKLSDEDRQLVYENMYINARDLYRKRLKERLSHE